MSDYSSHRKVHIKLLLHITEHAQGSLQSKGSSDSVTSKHCSAHAKSADLLIDSLVREVEQISPRRSHALCSSPHGAEALHVLGMGPEPAAGARDTAPGRTQTAPGQLGNSRHIPEKWPLAVTRSELVHRSTHGRAARFSLIHRVHQMPPACQSSKPRTSRSCVAPLMDGRRRANRCDTNTCRHVPMATNLAACPLPCASVVTIIQ